MAKGTVEMLTAKKFAERAGVTYPTIIAWLKKGLVPEAVLVEDSPHGAYWQIPATSHSQSLAKFLVYQSWHERPIY